MFLNILERLPNKHLNLISFPSLSIAMFEKGRLKSMLAYASSLLYDLNSIKIFTSEIKYDIIIGRGTKMNIITLTKVGELDKKWIWNNVYFSDIDSFHPLLNFKPYDVFEHITVNADMIMELKE